MGSTPINCIIGKSRIPGDFSLPEFLSFKEADINGIVYTPHRIISTRVEYRLLKYSVNNMPFGDIYNGG